MLSVQGMRGAFQQGTSEKPSWPEWKGKTAVCIATGPSLSGESLTHVLGARERDAVRVISVNDAGLNSRRPSASWADIWYAADDQFWFYYEEEARQSRAIRVGADLDKKALDAGIIHLYLNTMDNNRARAGEPGYALSGGHSGFQALQIALTSGADRVLLLGYDCRGSKGRTNYFGMKPSQLHRDSSYLTWPQHYREFRDRPIINCTPNSAIDCFEFANIEEALLWKK